MSGFVIWLIIVMGNLSIAIKAIAILLFVITVVASLFATVSAELGSGLGEDNKDKIRSKACFVWCRKAIIPCVALFLISCLIPTKREAAAIYVLPKIVVEAQESELPEALEELAIEWCKSHATKTIQENLND